MYPIKVFLFLALLLTSMSASEKDLMKELKSLDDNQRAVLLKIYINAKPFDWHLTMMSIAWKESKFGKYPINLQDPSCGVFHNLVDTVIKGNEYRKDSYTRNRVCSSLIDDFDFSFTEALRVLKYFENYWKSKNGGRLWWSKSVASYNAGFSWRNGDGYLEDIKKRVNVMKKYIKEKENIFSQVDRRFILD